MAKIEVTPWLDKWGKRVCDHPAFWMKLGKWEDALLQERISEIPITSPLFITGMARSGSTILLEILNEHPDTASFRYRDFPFVHIPWFWSQILNFSTKGEKPVERAHGDRIEVTSESPEAMEEMLWIHAFGSQLHEGRSSHLKEGSLEQGSFASHYISTIKKLLLINGAGRYLSKGNYNVTRIKYLLKLFPDARFIIPIRDPIDHVYSSIKQHRLFLEADSEDRRVGDQMHRMGHFEFGRGRKAINSGDPSDSLSINSLFAREENVRAYAKQWKVIYSYVNKLMRDRTVASSLMIVKYEELCNNSRELLEALFRHTGLSENKKISEKYEKKLSLPSYSKRGFSTYDEELVREITEETAKEFGYFRRENSLYNGYVA